MVAKYGGNPVSSESFHTYIPLYQVSTDFGTMTYPSPRSVTDHVIQTDRSKNPARIIAHYMPPHVPYLAELKNGEINIRDEPRPSTDFDAYIDNLRWALDEVELLLENVDRDNVVISSDHGENFFLRSMRAAHTPGMVAPSVRQVPWAETEAIDEETYHPKINEDQELTDINEMLEALGYV